MSNYQSSGDLEETFNYKEGGSINLLVSCSILMLSFKWNLIWQEGIDLVNHDEPDKPCHVQQITLVFPNNYVLSKLLSDFQVVLLACQCCG